jgi:hypothetical protein
MSEPIVFFWTGSARAREASTDPWMAKPAWAHIAGQGCAALSSTSPPATAPHWVLLQEPPVVGSIYPLRVWVPFRGALEDSVWVVYPPPTSDARMTEWCDVAAALPTGGLARCRLHDVLSHDEPDPVYAPGAWLQVAIEEVIALPNLAARFVPANAGRQLPLGITPVQPYLRGCHTGDLYYLDLSTEGDVHDWAVWQRLPKGAAVVLAGERIFDDDFFYAGRRFLSETELRDLETLQAEAERERPRTFPPTLELEVAPTIHSRHDDAAGRATRGRWRIWER